MFQHIIVHITYIPWPIITVRKIKLKKILEAGKLLQQRTSASKGKQQNTPAQSRKKQSLKFKIRWKHFNEDSVYKAKRIEQGGGVRTTHMKKDASALECLEVYFSQRKIMEQEINSNSSNWPIS